MPALLALAALLGLWRATVYVRANTCWWRHHEPVRHPLSYWRCRRCGLTATHVGEYLDLDVQQEYVDPNRLHRDHKA